MSESRSQRRADPRARLAGARAVLGLCGALLAAGLFAMSAPVLAHGEKPHSGTKSRAPAEQTAWGIAAEPAAVTRTILIGMNDRMRFVPDRFEVREGETVRLRVRNSGRLMHELVLGTRSELDAHSALMARFPGMEHDEPHMAHVAPGRSGEILWTFNRPGDFEFACLIAGHYQAGMRGTIRVLPASPSSTEGRKQDERR
jgi:uncharacterized cupredoxin-like copper-binding protein